MSFRISHLSGRSGLVIENKKLISKSGNLYENKDGNPDFAAGIHQVWTQLTGSWSVLEIEGQEGLEVARLMQIDAVILDYGQVLSLKPRPRDFEALQRTSGIDSSTFPAVFWQHRDAYDRGLLDGPAFWTLVARDAHTSFAPEQIEQLIALDIRLWVHPNPVILEWVRLLGGRGVKTAVLSNMPLDHSRYLRQNAAWLQAFNHLCFSGELGLGKPEAAIYRSCLEGLQVPASQALFIDDREVHVLGARAAGLHSVVFESVDQLAEDLEPFGLAESFAEAVERAGTLAAGSTDDALLDGTRE